MRKASLLIAAMLLLAGTLAAQQQSSQNSGQQDPLATAARAQAEREAQIQSNTCYTMRSYLFARSDGEAPRLVGMTTCTPGTRYHVYHAGQRAQFGLYPAMGRQQNQQAEQDER